MNRVRSIMFLVLGIVASLLVSLLPWTDALDRYGYDALLSSTAAQEKSNQVVVIGIDDAALKRFDDPLVFWHQYLAQVITGVARGGAKGIGLDIVPAVSLDRYAPELDRQLIKAIGQARAGGTEIFLGFKSGKSGLLPHRKFMFVASGLCLLNLYPDEDGKIRRQTLELTSAKRKRKAYAMSQCLARLGVEEMKNANGGRPYIDYRLSLPPQLAFTTVYEWGRTGQLDNLRRVFQDKLVFIGITSAKLPDIYTVPMDIYGKGGDWIPGVVIHAFTTKTLLGGRLLQDFSPAARWLLLIGLGLCSGLLFLYVSPLRAVIFLTIAAAIVVMGVYQAFIAYHLVPTGIVAIGMIVPGAVTGICRYAVEYWQFRRLRRYFASYVNPHVMRQIIEHPEFVAFEGERVVPTVMFTDICGFTTLSEGMDPQSLVTGLNRYFSEMTQSVLEAGGYLNRFLGDGILAIFGAPNQLPDNGAMAAVQCGMKMLERLEALNKTEIFPGYNEVAMDIGIGVHTGEAVVGNIGCYEKMDYSIMGDTVNLASRIEGKTRDYEARMLISEATYERVKDHIEARFVDVTTVKGRRQEVKLYEVLQIRES